MEKTPVQQIIDEVQKLTVNNSGPQDGCPETAETLKFVIESILKPKLEEELKYAELAWDEGGECFHGTGYLDFEDFHGQTFGYESRV